MLKSLFGGFSLNIIFNFGDSRLKVFDNFVTLPNLTVEDGSMCFT